MRQCKAQRQTSSKAMLLVDEWIQAEGDGRVKLLMQVHDELVFEVEESHL